MRFSKRALLLMAASGLVAATQAQAQSAATTASDVVRFGTWGVDLSARDLLVRPGDDFQRYALGKWTDATVIPADQAESGVAFDMYNRNQERLRSIITSAPKDSQLGALYASWMDEARIEQADAAPLKSDLARLEDAIKTQVASDTHSPERFRVIGPLRNLDAWYQAFGVGPDSKFYVAPEKRVRIW